MKHPDHRSPEEAGRAVRSTARRAGWALFLLMLLAIGPLEGAPGAPEADLRQAEEELSAGHYGEAIASFEVAGTRTVAIKRCALSC